MRFRGAPHVRHFIMHMRRASYGSAPWLNCEVRRQVNSMSVQVWGLRVLFLGSLGILPSALAGSPFPAFAFGLAWGPNGLFLMWFLRGALHLPSFLVVVHPVEPALYRWLGVGLVKRIVATRMWHLMNFQVPPQAPK